jgi:hypothetical protein
MAADEHDDQPLTGGIAATLRAPTPLVEQPA